MKDSKDILWELIAQEMAGKLDIRSAAQLRELLGDPENKAIYDVLNAVEVEDITATKGEQQEVLDQMFRKIMRSQAAMKPHRGQVFRITASLIFALLAGGLGYRFLMPQPCDQWVDYTCQAGGYSSLSLSDETQVDVNSASKLHYPVCFTGDERCVELDGEAFFRVRKNASRPFIVRTDLIEIKVLGTSFNIRTYKTDSLVYATLVEGSIELSVLGHDKRYLLRPNEQACISKRDGSVAISEVDPDYDTAWREGHLTFYKMKFSDICSLLRRRYGYSVVVSDVALSETVFTGRFLNGENIFQVLDVIRRNTPFSYSLSDGNVITVSASK